MRVIDVNAFLDREMGTCDGVRSSVGVLKEFDDANIDYAILSHRWGDEVTYDEVIQLTRIENRDEIRRRCGYLKIMKACQQAQDDNLNWLWVDTCCIDKRSSSELSEAINSMFRWYGNSKRCYAYLHDTSVFPTARDFGRFRESNGWPEWFSRGWTLQELIAPRVIQFFNEDWKPIGDKGSLASKLQEITRVPANVLKNGLPSNRSSVAQIISWAADRRTTRVEDRAYSLMGLLDVNMPMLYGEGKKAFQRLQLEVIRMSTDQSIFAWDPEGKTRQTTNVLADDPGLFRDCHDIVEMEPKEINKELPSLWKLDVFLAIPERKGSLAFTVTNAGIQIGFPLLPYWGCPSLFQAALACRREGSRVPITIDLASLNTKHYRYFGATGGPKPSPTLGQLYLAYQAEPRHDFTFEVDDRTIPYCGFARRDVFPKEVASIEDTIVLSRTCPLAVMLYDNGKPNGYFAVAFGHCFGQEWVHVVVDDRGSLPPSDAVELYARMWNAGAEYARRMDEAHFGTHSNSQHEPYRIKHRHLNQSIFGVEVACGRLEKSGHYKVIIDIVKCPGCCQEPLEWGLSYGIGGGDTPGLMLPLTYWPVNPDYHQVSVDGVAKKFVPSETLQETQLGDYYDNILQHSHGSVHRQGNIFQDLHLLPPEIHLDLDDPELQPVVHRISSESGLGTDNLDVTSMVGEGGTDAALVLRRPIGLSLPNTGAVAVLLRALSARGGNCGLVTTIIRCSACRQTDRFKAKIRKHPQAFSEFWRTYSPVDFTDHTINSDERPITPLFQIMRPWTWTRAVQVPDPMTRVEFRKIHGYFKSILELDTGKDAAIDFFMKLFGVQYLGMLVGNVIFFNSLASLSRAAEEDNRKTQEVNTSGSPEGQPCAQAPAAVLMNGPRVTDSCNYLLWLSDMQRAVHDIHPITKTLGFEFIQDITIGFLRAKTVLDGLGGGERHE
ncbi:hypothetical protein EDC04DRAFT_1549837 [Pisolithus marmoratus]|nr:hypothetical protein EDC04DRAFT_1549837 [Pisolithus marmoratus]